MSLEGNKAIVRRWNDEIWNKGNVDIVDELAAANYVSHSDTPDREAFKQFAIRLRAAFSDGGVTIEDMIAEGDRLAIRWTMYGTHTGKYMGVAPTGKRITMSGISIYRIENDKIAEDWPSPDMLDVIQQLGVIPPMGEGKG